MIRQKKESSKKKLDESNCIIEFPKNEMFINCLYDKGEYNEEDAIQDSIIVISKDKNGEKHITFKKCPSYSYYVTKTGVDRSVLRNYIPISECNKINVRYRNRFSSMSKSTPSKETKEYFEEVKRSGDWKAKNKMHLFAEFHGSDINIEDYYINEFLEQNDFNENNFGITFDAYDIEVDGADHIGFADENEAPCPINIISSYFSGNNTLYLFCLKYDTETFKEFKERYKIIEAKIRKKYKKYFGDFKIRTKIFKDEFGVINAFFKQINTDKPDYATAWNCYFDVMTMYQRLKKLLVGSEIYPEDVMCPKEFPIKKVIIKKDTSLNASDIADRFDLFQIFGYTIWIDFMCLYANITKPLGKKESYALDAIIGEELDEHKVDLESFGTTIKTAHYDNYSLFFEYNSIDSLSLAALIQKKGFLTLMHNIVMMTRTRPNKALKKTVCLRNFASVFYKNNGMAISNNHSSLAKKLEEKVKGAYVADPNLNEPLGSINGLPTNKIFSKVIDEDLTSLYPCIDMAFNISPDTMRYKIKWVTKPKSIMELNEDQTEIFMDHYISNDPVKYCVTYHKLPNISEMYEMLKEKIPA